MNYTIRDMAEADITEVCELCIKSAEIYLDLEVLTKGQFSTFFNMTVTKQRMFSEFSDPNTSCSVAVDAGGQIIGFCKGNKLSKSNEQLMAEQFNRSAKPAQKTFHLQSIYVSPDKKISGIGSRLMQAEINKALQKGFTKVFTTTLSGNNSPGFFKKYGAKLVGKFIQNPFTNEVAEKVIDKNFLKQEAYIFEDPRTIMQDNKPQAQRAIGLKHAG